MPKSLLAAFLLLTSLNSGATQEPDAPPHPAVKAFELYRGNGALPPEYSMKVIEKPNLLGSEFARRLDTLTRQRIKLWKKFVVESGRFDDLSAEKRKLALTSPKQFLKVNYLLEIIEVTAIYKKGTLVGYHFHVNDYVKSAMIEDGAWVDFVTDEQLNVLFEEEGTA